MTVLNVVSWQPPPPPASFCLDLGAGQVVVASSWEDAASRVTPVEVQSTALLDMAVRAISVRIGRQAPRVKTFLFPEARENIPAYTRPDVEAVGTRMTRRLTPPAHPCRGSTHVKPPGDIVKLEDKLLYLLQPPLEALWNEAPLQVPFAPFPYQFAGIAFLYPRHAAILADEMGLGKTMQAITAIRLLLRRGEIRQALLVCPKPLVTNWQREFATWAPEVPVAPIAGDQSRRQFLWALDGVPVKIANYELLLRDQGFLAQNASANRFDLVILDEAQRIKNRAGATSQAIREVAGCRRWALTGTPVENSPEDLVGIFEFLDPGFLSPGMKPRAMGRAVRDHVLRRTKEQVLSDLPPKLFRDAEMDLTPEQHETYRAAEDEGILRLNTLGEGVTVQHVFELILRLKQICNFDPVTGASAKLERLEADLEEVASSGRKAIVFSQWVETLTRLRTHLGRFGPLEYHGQIPFARRDAVLARFRDDRRSHVLLVSYGAGGLGLNLQFAGYVFLFDRWWNPAVEDQAVNRAHRIGAAGPVTVARFLMLDTIEERINRILEEKRDLFDTIFHDAAGPQRLGLSQEELFGLFDLRTPRGPIDVAA